MGIDDQRRVTIAAIAREAGVSVPTVSRVINGRTDVAAGTRLRVEKLLARHDYRRRLPRAAGGDASLIDLVFNDLNSPGAVEIIRGVEGVAHASGAGTVVSAIHERTAPAGRWMHNLRARASDGVILVTSELASPLHAELQRLNVGVVVVDPAGVPSLDVPTIGAANWTGGLHATQHLIGLGHKRIGFVAGPLRLPCSRARLDGYRAACEAAGLTVSAELIREGEFSHEAGFAGGRTLLELREPPTAIFAASDQLALGVYEAVRRLGLRVPDDVSVIGFDDLPEVRWFSPPLTTVRQPLAEMGMLAARTVLRLARGEKIESPRVELATELVVRHSTAPPR